jgi:hypothetical protein
MAVGRQRRAPDHTAERTGTVTNLARIQSLRVVSRTSATHYKGSRQTVPGIARELRVACRERPAVRAPALFIFLPFAAHP